MPAAVPISRGLPRPVAEVSRRKEAARPAADTSTEPQAEINWADRRGPLRPGQLISTRARVRGEALSRTFRAVDAVVVLGLAWLCCVSANPAGVWMSPVADVVPFLGTAVLVIWVRSRRRR